MPDVRKVKIVLNGEQDGDRIIVQAVEGACERTDHLKVVLRDQYGREKTLDLLIHPEEVEDRS